MLKKKFFKIYKPLINNNKFILWGLWGFFGSYRAHNNYIKKHSKHDRNSMWSKYYVIDHVLKIISGFILYSVPPFMLYSFYKELLNFEDFMKKI